MIRFEDSPEHSTDEAKVRVADLARSAGLSVQQIRNYVAAGMLPATERADNRYRVFTTRHADALSVARTLIDGYGWQPALDAMRAAHAGDLAGASTVADRSHADLDRERAEINALLQTLDGPLPNRLQVQRPLRIGDVAAIAGVRPSALRVWEGLGLLSPTRDRGTGYRTYNQVQLIRARVVAMLRDSGYSLAAVKDVVDAMREGDSARTGSVLRSRLQELNQLSWKRMQATAALYGYLERTRLSAAGTP